MVRWKVPRKVCPVGGCAEPIRVDRVMCVFHWRTVPPKLRRAHQKIYRAWKIDRRNLESIRALRESAGLCIESAER